MRECLLEAFIRRPVPGISGALIPMLSSGRQRSRRATRSPRAIGKTGFDKDVENKLFELMKDEQLMNDAALALILGGTPDVAARAVAMYADKNKTAIEELQNLWYDAFGYWSDEDLTSGSHLPAGWTTPSPSPTWSSRACRRNGRPSCS